MGSPRDGLNGRDATMPLRIAEARLCGGSSRTVSARTIAADKRWVICGDFNDYRERVAIGGDAHCRLSVSRRSTSRSGLDVLLADGFCENIVERRPELDRWTLYHTRGPEERHLCQLDYILLSPALARQQRQGGARHHPQGQPWRTLFPPGQEVERYPRAGWDRPKASDHCPVAVTLDIV